uniref:Probable imidazolonepropionase n=1 Tax=Eptatretus burgeri TaxID=7764 RepID=A0A8C4QT52_EPTBU
MLSMSMCYVFTSMILNRTCSPPQLAGASYLDIHQAGGGIHYTMQHTRTAKQEQLLHSLRIRLFAMLRAGSTLVECKTGYGLDLDTETRMLRAIERARWHDRPAVHVTYCGAHAVPRGHLVSEYTREIVEKHLPTVVSLMHQGEVHVDSVDVFCEKGVFGLEETRTILSTGKNLGLRLNFHGDELHPTGAAELAAELGAHAVSHLEEVSNDGISALVTAGCVAILLPTTAFMLRLKQPPARTMIDAGVIVALGSDFNPNAYCLAMPVVMHLACVNLHLTMAEALVAATINAAHALGCSHRHGSIEQGKRGDLLIVKASRWEHLIYQLGCHADLIPYVVCKGDVVENRCPSYNAAL